MEQEFVTQTIRKTIHPVWEESFEVKLRPVKELTASPLRFEGKRLRGPNPRL